MLDGPRSTYRYILDPPHTLPVVPVPLERLTQFGSCCCYAPGGCLFLSFASQSPNAASFPSFPFQPVPTPTEPHTRPSRPIGILSSIQSSSGELNNRPVRAEARESRLPLFSAKSRGQADDHQVFPPSLDVSIRPHQPQLYNWCRRILILKQQHIHRAETHPSIFPTDRPILAAGLSDSLARERHDPRKCRCILTTPEWGPPTHGSTSFSTSCAPSSIRTSVPARAMNIKVRHSSTWSAYRDCRFDTRGANSTVSVNAQVNEMQLVREKVYQMEQTHMTLKQKFVRSALVRPCDWVNQGTN